MTILTALCSTAFTEPEEAFKETGHQVITIDKHAGEEVTYSRRFLLNRDQRELRELVRYRRSLIDVPDHCLVMSIL
ncbi:hypothetical protein MKY20_25690 [Cytobacillus sp. FSL W8-0315]|uniref:hypothetical protein n=1 Tax=Cytobacillus sp. FSL W8-0315 TaxID=2921600 RepID=UPI0030F67806